MNKTNNFEPKLLPHILQYRDNSSEDDDNDNNDYGDDDGVNK